MRKSAVRENGTAEVLQHPKAASISETKRCVEQWLRPRSDRQFRHVPKQFQLLRIGEGVGVRRRHAASHRLDRQFHHVAVLGAEGRAMCSLPNMRGVMSQWGERILYFLQTAMP